MDEEEHVEFSKMTQDKIIGTKGEIATVSIFLVLIAIIKVLGKMWWHYCSLNLLVNLNSVRK